MLGLASCKKKEKNSDDSEIIESIANDLEIDHFNIWVKNPQKTKKLLNDIGFTSIPDSLSTIHEGQGTTGKYFYFLNGYFELIFVLNQKEFEENNRKNNDLDFAQRANFDQNGASPFSLALKMKDYDVSKIPFQKVSYHQDWMEKDANIYSARKSKINLNEPSIFVVPPYMEADTFGTIEDLKNIPEEYAFFREFFKHPNGARKITSIKITSNNIDLGTETMRSVDNIDRVTIKKGEAHLMELFFDDHKQGKTFDLRPQLPLIVYL